MQPVKCSPKSLQSTLTTNLVCCFFCQCLTIGLNNNAQSVNLFHLDLNLLVQQFKYIRTLLETEPWKSVVVTEVNPGPACKSDEQIKGTLQFLATNRQLFNYAVDRVYKADLFNNDAYVSPPFLHRY